MPVLKRKPRRRGKGAVGFIVAMFVVSAILRLWIGPGPAVAEAVNKATSEQMAAGTSKMAPEQDNGAEIGRADISALLKALQEREERIKQREEQIEKRNKALMVANDEIAKRMALLAETEERLRETLALADGAAESDIARLTAVYENMKPKNAAALFEAMEPDFAAGFLGRMRPDAAAAVMAGLSPEAAYSISVILAGRNANAPKS